MNVWRVAPRYFMARWLHPLAIKLIAWRLKRKSLPDPETFGWEQS